MAAEVPDIPVGLPGKRAVATRGRPLRPSRERRRSANMERDSRHVLFDAIGTFTAKPVTERYRPERSLHSRRSVEQQEGCHVHPQRLLLPQLGRAVRGTLPCARKTHAGATPRSEPGEVVCRSCYSLKFAEQYTEHYRAEGKLMYVETKRISVVL